MGQAAADAIRSRDDALSTALGAAGKDCNAAVT